MPNKSVVNPSVLSLNVYSMMQIRDRTGGEVSISSIQKEDTLSDWEI